MSKSGFTLAEVLVAITALTILGVVIVEVFLRSLQGGNKATVLANIKQNGQGALEIMDKTIRSANAVVCPITMNSSDVVAVEKDGLFTRFRFIYPSGENGYIEQDNPSEFSASICSSGDLPAFPTILTDTNTKSGVNILQPGSFFKKDKKAGFKDVVTIQFRLSPGVKSAGGIISKIDPVTFTTTVELR